MVHNDNGSTVPFQQNADGTYAAPAYATATLAKNADGSYSYTPANATAEVKENAKAVAEGVKEGLHRGDTVDLNKASKSDLMNLPGMTSEDADRVIAAGPMTTRIR